MLTVLKNVTQITSAVPTIRIHSEPVFDPSAQYRQEVQTRWRNRLEIARSRYQALQERCKAAVKEHGGEGTPSAEGKLAIRRALKAEMTALDEYRRVLEVFGALLVQGKIPTED